MALRFSAPFRCSPSRPGAWAAAAAMIALWSGGCATNPDPDFEPVIARFNLETAPQDPNATRLSLPVSGVEIPVHPRYVLTEADVRNVELVQVDLGLCLMFEFTADASRTLLSLSAANLGRRLVLTLNGRAFGARTFDTTLTNGQMMIFVEMPDPELTATAVDLKKTAQHIQAAIARGQKKPQQQ